MRVEGRARDAVYVRDNPPMALALEHDVPLQPLNAFGVAACARALLRVRSAHDLAALAADAALAAHPRLVLGGGSNLLLTRDLDEMLVLRIEVPGVQEMAPSATHWRIEVGAGENWHALVQQLVARDRPGLENLALIPGSCGAAPVQNIGAYGLELAERFESLRAWDFQRQAEVTLGLAECRFGYRDSLFKREPGRYAILSMTLALPRPWTPVMGYADVEHELRSRGVARPTPRDLFDVVVAIRRRKLPDPAVIGNAGSFFKNPIVSREKQAELVRHFPSLVSYPLPGGRYKLAAGWLIEAAGLKGATRGRAGVYEKQALVLVNRGGATGAEILALAREVQSKVAEKFGVELDPEPVIV